MEMNPELEKYYNYLKSVGADVPPTFASFQSTLQDENSAKQYFNYLKEKKYDTPDNFDSFSNTFGLKKKDVSQPSSQPSQTSSQDYTEPSSSPPPTNDPFAKYGLDAHKTPQQQMAEYGTNVQQAKQEVTKERVKNAAVNTAKLYFKNNRITPTKSSLNAKVKELKQAHDNGNLITYSEGGEDRLARPMPFYGDLWEGIKNDVSSLMRSGKLMTMSDDEKIAELNKKKEPDTQYLPEKADESSLSYGIGSALPTTALAVGSAALAETPAGAIGLSLLATEPKVVGQTYETSLEQYYKRAKSENPNIPDHEALDMAKKAATASAAESGITNAAMMVAGGESLPKGEGQGLIKATTQFLKNQPKSIAATGAVAGVGSELKDEIAKKVGFKVTDQEISDNLGSVLKGNTLMQLAFNIGSGVFQVPKYLKSQGLEVLSNAKPEEVQTVSDAAVKNGDATQVQADKLAEDLKDYNKAKQSVPEGLSEEKTGVLAGLIQKKQQLETKVKSLDPNFKDQVEAGINEILAIDKKINLAKRAKEPLKVEADNLTGEKNIQEEPKTENNVQESPTGKMGTYAGGDESTGGSVESSGMGRSQQGNETTVPSESLQENANPQDQNNVSQINTQDNGQTEQAATGERRALPATEGEISQEGSDQSGSTRKFYRSQEAGEGQIPGVSSKRQEIGNFTENKQENETNQDQKGDYGRIIEESGSKARSENGFDPNAFVEEAKRGYSKPDEQVTELSQDRTSSKTSQRIQPAKTTTSNPPNKLNKIISSFADDLKSTVIYSPSKRRNAAGSYKPSNALINIRNAGDIDTVAHEMGHAIDDKFDILNQAQNPKAQDELKWFYERGGSNPPKGANRKEYLNREGLAEYIRAYIANPAEAKAAAPELTKVFEKIDKPVLDAVKKFSGDYLDFANATAGEKILANVMDSKDIKDKKGAVEWLKNWSKSEDNFGLTWADRLQDHVVNSLHSANIAFQYANKLKGIQDMTQNKNFNILSRVFAGVNGKIDRVFEAGLIDSENNILKDGNDNMTLKWLFDPLDKSDVKTIESDARDVIKLMVAERTVEYAGKFTRTENLTGIGGGIKSDLSVAAEHINDFNKLKTTDTDKYNRIKEAARRYRTYADATLKYALDKGRISQEQYDAIKDNNKYYVSLARVKEVSPTEEPLSSINQFSKGGLASVKGILHKAAGGTELIQNPYTSLIKNTVDIITEADRNDVMQSFVNSLAENRGMGQGEVKQLSAIGREVPMSETKNAKTIYIKGEPKKFQFDADVYRSLTSMESTPISGVGKMFTLPAKILRWSVVHFPVFAARNIVRDTVSRLILSHSGSGIKEMIHSLPDRELFDLYGGSQAGFHLINRDAYYNRMRETMHDMVDRGHIVISPKKLLESYPRFLEKSENVNRIAEFKAAFKKAKSQGLDDYNAGLQAAYEARDLMDFAVAGHTIRWINQIVPFTNAAVQGLRRSALSIKENPVGFGLKMALYTVVPTLITRSLVHAMGDDKEYEQLPGYIRDLNWNFKTPYTGDKWISIPKPFDLGLVSSFIDRTISKGSGVDNAYDELAHSAFSALSPFDEGSLLGPFHSIVEISANKDFFRDKTIIPDWEENLALRKRAGTKDASRLGKMLSEAFGLAGAEADPRYIDFFIKSNASYYGDLAVRLSDLGKKDSRNKFGVAQTGFARDIQISGAKDVKAAYNMAERLGVEQHKDVKELKGMVKDYYGLETDAEREEASKKIYNHATKLRKDLEAQDAYEKEHPNEVKKEKHKAHTPPKPRKH